MRLLTNLHTSIGPKSRIGFFIVYGDIWYVLTRRTLRKARLPAAYVRPRPMHKGITWDYFK